MFITINNWQKYNPRPDLRAWYRMDAQILNEPKLHGLKPQDWVVLLYIMGRVCEGKGSFELVQGHAEKETGLRGEAIFDAIYRIRLHGFCQVSEEAPSPPALPTNQPTTYVCDAEELYLLYPKRAGDQGKKMAFDRIKRQITNEQLHDQLRRAICNYAQYAQVQGIVGTQYVKQFRTFMSVWTEWVDREPAPSAAAAKWEELTK